MLTGSGYTGEREARNNVQEFNCHLNGCCSREVGLQKAEDTNCL